MGRRVYIVPKDYPARQAKEEALANNCPEICREIPPRYRGRVTGPLPQVYEEPEPPREEKLPRAFWTWLKSDPANPREAAIKTGFKFILKKLREEPEEEPTAPPIIPELRHR